MENTDIAVSELADHELDMVAAGSLSMPHINIDVPININVGVGVATQVNLALFSKYVTQGGNIVIGIGQVNG